MVHFVSQQSRREKEGAQNGNGIVKFRDIFTPEELGERANMCSVITLDPGCSVGVHAHVDNGEVYCILDGEAVVTEDGAEYTLHPGDAEFCADGHTHGIENRTGETVTFLAVILPNP